MDKAGHNALSQIDKLLAHRAPEDFPAATRWIAAYRDELAAIWRRSGSETDRRRLAKVNAVLSVVVGAHFPLGEIPWPLVEKARTLLSNVVS